MATISGVSNWRLIVQRHTTGITILRAVTCDRCATLPDTLFDLPVTALGDHAFAGGTVSGEEVCITCGPSDGEWDNRKLQELTLPKYITKIDNYAFLNCRALRTLQLYDAVQHWGVGAVMNCQSLRRILLTRLDAQQGETLAYLAGELSRELDVSIFDTDGSQTRLLFPEYMETYEENSPAHHFDYVIYGAGHPYHHVFRGKTLHLADFDALWTRFLAVEHDEAAALQLSWWRLRFPQALDNAARAAYERYLRTHSTEALSFALTQQDLSGLRQLLPLLSETPEAISHALSLARQQRNTEAIAILLEQQHRTHRGDDKTFDL